MGVLLLAVLLAPLALAGCGREAPRAATPVERVLIVSLPGVTWAEVRRSDLPNLRALVRDSAIADMSTRIGRSSTTTAAAYLTLGAGTRAVVPGIDGGVALNPDELHGGVSAADILRRRLGSTPAGVAYIPVGATIDANARSPYGAEPGLLGDELAAAGVGRAVIANADAAEGFPTDEPPPDGAYARSAVTALMSSDGIVPGGSVSRQRLLQDDAAAPFGRQLNPEAVLEEFDRAWKEPGRSVVLVEASDLSRASAYGTRGTRPQGAKLRAEALTAADELLGRLLERVDGDQDAVLVVSPTSTTGLGVASLRTPDVDGGLLLSASTRRAGYVYLADVAPTILELMDIAVPGAMEGRPFAVSSSSGERMQHLISQATAAATRDQRLPVVVQVVIAGLVVLALATWRWDRRRIAHAGGLPVRAGGRAVAAPTDRRPVLVVAAVAALGVVPGTFLAGLAPVTHRSDAAYWAVVLAVALLVGGLGWLAERRLAGTGALVGVGSILAVIATDLLVGAPLQVNSVFGYSMAVAGRFTGIGNLAFSLFGAAAVSFVVLLVDRFGAGVLPWAGALLVGVVLIEGLPIVGADVGGVVSMVPAFSLTVLALLGRRIGFPQLVLAVAAGFVVVVVFGLVDAALPSGSQTHLARLGGQVTGDRVGAVDDVLLRRLHASFGGSSSVSWLLALGAVTVAGVQALLVAEDRVGPSSTRPPRAPATVALWVGLGVLATLGLAANDSSIAVPTTMLIVVVPVLVLRHLAPPSAPTAPAEQEVAAP